jgi:sugar phosphate isomerase/epimerase
VNTIDPGTISLGVDHLTELDLAPVAFTRAAAVAGFSSVSLRIIHIAGGVAAWADTPLNAPALAREAADRGVGIHAIEAVAITADLAARIDALKPQLQQGAELGASLLYSFADDTDVTRCAESFALLAEAAAQFGLRTLLEPMPYRAIATLSQASQVVRESGTQGGLIVDVLHATRGGSDPRTLATLPHEQLAVLQLCDAPASAPAAPSPSGLHPLLHEARFDRRQPGEGDLPIAGFAAAMPAGALITVEAPLASTSQPAEMRLGVALAAARQAIAGDVQ